MTAEANATRDAVQGGSIPTPRGVQGQQDIRQYMVSCSVFLSSLSTSMATDIEMHRAVDHGYAVRGRRTCCTHTTSCHHAGCAPSRLGRGAQPPPTSTSTPSHHSQLEHVPALQQSGAIVASRQWSFNAHLPSPIDWPPAPHLTHSSLSRCGR